MASTSTSSSTQQINAPINNLNIYRWIFCLQDRAQEALNFVLEHLPKADRGSQGTLLREATLLCSSYPVLFTEKMLQEVRQVGTSSSPSASSTIKYELKPRNLILETRNKHEFSKKEDARRFSFLGHTEVK